MVLYLVTSIQYRINAVKAGKTPKYLTPFAGNIKEDLHLSFLKGIIISGL